jgi:hypothetical protein
VPGVPVAVNSGCGFSISRFVLHLTQYAFNDIPLF